MASQYYVYHNRPLEIYEVEDFTLINSLNIPDIITYKWYHDEILILAHQKIIMVDPLEGEINNIELNHDIFDMTVFKDHIWGIYDQGVIEIKIGSTTPLRTIKFEGLKQIISGKDEIFLKSDDKIYKMIKRQITEVDEVECVRIDYIDDALVIIKRDEVVINHESFPHKNVNKVIKFNHQYGFITDNKTIFNGVQYDNIIDIITIDNEIKFITKNSNGDLEIKSQSVRQLPNLLDDSKQTIDYCNKYYDESRVKSDIKSLSSSQQIQLYEIIIPKISKNTLNNQPLSVWLKWLLIINKPGLNSVPSKSLKLLNTNLSQSNLLINNLLSIKGKLNLIKLQNDLKNKKITIEQDFDNDDDSIYIANGENDEE